MREAKPVQRKKSIGSRDQTPWLRKLDMDPDTRECGLFKEA